MFEVDINLWAVLVAAVVYFVIGGLWFSVLFGKQWMKLSGITMEEAGKNSNAGLYGSTFLLQLFLTYVLAHVVAHVGAVTVVDGLITGLWLGLGFVATTMLVDSLYAGRPRKLTAINAGYHLVGIMVAAAILSVWV